MIDFWTLGPSAAAFGLRARGFTPQEADRLVALKLRHERGEFRELTEFDHLCFLRWRVEHGRYDSDLPYETAHGERINQ